MTKLTPAVFIDRDGTLIKDADYLSKIEDVELIDGTIEALKKLNNKNLPAFMVSNQSGVARGYFTEDTVKTINDEIKKIFQKNGVYLSGYYYCPHHIKGSIKEYTFDCNCRKPKDGMIKQCLKDFPNIDLKNSFVIGDKEIDIELAKNAGCKGILVLTGYGNTIENPTPKPDYIAKDINDAVDWILTFN